MTAEERERPAVLFLHGWPESWYSWRFQLAAVKAAGYRGVAPSMRGYGGTEAPDDYASYNAYTLVRNLTTLPLHHLVPLTVPVASTTPLSLRRRRTRSGP